jgi:hypothetical protein
VTITGVADEFCTAAADYNATFTSWTALLSPPYSPPIAYSDPSNSDQFVCKYFPDDVTQSTSDGKQAAAFRSVGSSPECRWSSALAAYELFVNDDGFVWIYICATHRVLNITTSYYWAYKSDAEFYSGGTITFTYQHLYKVTTMDPGQAAMPIDGSGATITATFD